MVSSQNETTAVRIKYVQNLGQYPAERAAVLPLSLPFPVTATEAKKGHQETVFKAQSAQKMTQ